jgi:hypothetical protein
MPSTYTGAAAGLTERTDPVELTVPADGDSLTAASINVAVKKCADWLKKMQDAVGFLSTANTWAGAQTFSGGLAADPAFPARTVTELTASGANGFAQPATAAERGRYYKDVNGDVVLEGGLVYLQNASNPLSPFDALPAGFRPPVSRYFVVVQLTGGVGANGYQLLRIEASGVATLLVNRDTANPEENGIICLDGVRFRPA